jgi:hypothetical protein
VAEEHGVGDRPEEGRADHHPRDGQGGGVTGRHARGDQADHPDDRRHQVERRWELGRVIVDDIALAVDPGHGGDPCTARLDAIALAGHARGLALDRHDQRGGARQHHPGARQVADDHLLAVAPAEEECTQGHQPVGAA